jgi:hypothetical protein
VEGFAPLSPDQGDEETQMEGAYHRLLRAPPRRDNAMMRRFRGFVRVWLRHNLDPLPADTDLSFESWLEHTHYPEWRKEEIRRAHVLVLDKKKHFKNKSFIKAESYQVPKHARWINSRDDGFKAFSGPLFHAIEKAVFKLKWFVKFIPVADRATYIKEYVDAEGSLFIATDYTSLEASLVSQMMMCAEIQLYTYMLGETSRAGDIPILVDALTSLQHCRASGMLVTTFARMSGDMCTSLGNGFTNLMLQFFIAKECGWDLPLVGVVEGDDGLFRVSGPIPADNVFEALGMRIKLDVFDRVGDAGFCQLYFSDDCSQNLRDPIKILVRTGWTMSRFMHAGERVMMELLRAKAFSLLCETPTCPIVCAYALWLVRATKGHKIADPYMDVNSWWVDQLMRTSNLDKCIDLASAGPTLGQRLFVASKWGVGVQDQIDIEAHFNSLDDICVVTHPAVLRHCYQCFPWWSWAWDVLRCPRAIGESW